MINFLWVFMSDDDGQENIFAHPELGQIVFPDREIASKEQLEASINSFAIAHHKTFRIVKFIRVEE